MPEAKISLDGYTSGQKDVLLCLFVFGPTYDGSIPSKQARDELEDQGYLTHAHGWAFLTEKGVKLCIQADVKGFSDQRWYRKQQCM